VLLDIFGSSDSIFFRVGAIVIGDVAALALCDFAFGDFAPLDGLVPVAASVPVSGLLSVSPCLSQA